MIVLFLKVRLI